MLYSTTSCYLMAKYEKKGPVNILSYSTIFETKMVVKGLINTKKRNNNVLVREFIIL